MYFDGKKAPIEALGNRDFRFAVKNGLQNALIIYHKSDKRSQARMFLVGYQPREPISVSAKNHLAATNFLIQPSEPPIVIRRKIERLPRRSIAVGTPGSSALRLQSGLEFNRRSVGERISKYRPNC